MNTDSSNGSAPAARYQSPKECPRPALPLLTPDGRRPATRPADATDSRERALLMRAFAQANADLAGAQEVLGEKGTEAVETFQEAMTAIDAVERFEAGRTAREAQRQVGEVRVRHAEDGPESLRRAPRLWRFLLWPTIAAGVGFDTVFVGTIMQRFFKLAPGDISYNLAYLPAFGVAVTLLAAGTLLAESVFRRRVRADRRAERVRRGPIGALQHWFRKRPPRTERRRPDDLPWSNLTVPVLFTVLLFVGLGTIARIRAADGAQGSRTLVAAQDMVVILILVLSAATVIVKILAHNPYADRDKEAANGAKAADKKLRELVARARQALVRHSTAWHRLRAAVEQASADAHRVLDDACARIVEERAETGVAGSFDLPLRDHAWPGPQDAGGPATPRLRLEALEHLYGLLERYAPDLLENWLDEIAERLNGQFALGDVEARGAAAGAAGNAAAVAVGDAAAGATGDEPGGNTEPSAAEPATAEPSAEEPSEAEPAAADRTVTEPAAAEQAVTEPAAAERTVTEPAASQPPTAEPTTSQPQPATSQPATSQPATSQPATSQPATSQPATSQPATSQPATSQPTTAQSTTAQSTTAEPAAP